MDTKQLFAPKKGKDPTKGQKLIQKENAATLKLYFLMAFISFIAKLFFAPRAISLSFACIVQLVALGGMRHMAKPDGSAIDLNLANSFADRVKDVVITTTACCVLSIFSEFFWLLWLWLPAHLIYTVWVNVIAPWIFQPAPEEAPEIMDKKRKKMERRAARFGQGR